ncbi:O-antigen ligase family protein [Sphingomonas aestuarii]
MMSAQTLSADRHQPAALQRAVASTSYLWLGNILVALALVGYPLVSSVTQAIGVGSSEVNIGYRAVVMALSLFLTGWSLVRGTYRVDPLIGLFFALYSIRLMIDLNYSMLSSIEDDAAFFVATVLIPTLAMGGAKDWFRERRTLVATMILGGIAGLFIAYHLATGALSAELAEQSGGRATLEFLNPISIGYHGLFMAMAAVILIAQHRRRTLVVPCLFVAALGAYLLIASGSRGPILAMLIGLIVTGAANRHANATYVVGAMLAAGAIGYLGLPEGVIDRFRDIGSDASALDRLYAIQLSIDAALENLWFGYAYIEPVTGLYPHNLLIEAGLAMGIIGLVLMIWIQIWLLWNAWHRAMTGQWMLPYLAALMFTNAWISGAIWNSSIFFIVTLLMRSIPAQNIGRSSY